MTEGFLSRSPLPRLLQSLVVAALVSAAGLCASTALAAQAEYAGPSTTPLATSAATAKPDDGGPRWADLSAAHRKVLAPLSNDWNGLDARSKERWIDVAGRYPKMGPDEQQRANLRMGEWSRMTVAQRTQARMNFQETRGLSKEEREARWKAYQALPDEKKRELAAKRVATPVSPASATAAVPRRRAPPPLDSVQPKNNLISSAQARTAAGSAPSGASQRPGITTTLLNRRATPPAHQRDGGLKISAGPNSVDRTTLLPKHTTVAAASAGASAPAALHR
jgi:hypothetical protein